MYLTLRVEQIGFHQGIRRVDQTDSVGHERVAVKIRLQWNGGDAPDALFVFLHDLGLCALASERDFLGVWGAETECGAAVRVYFGRDHRLSVLRGLAETPHGGERE
jgi:hypothetical protein